MEERRTDIIHLDLTNNSLMDLDDFPSFLNLEVLNLAANNITDLSLHNFDERFPSLKVFNIRENPISCSDFRYIKNSLQSIVLSTDTATVHRCHNKSTSEELEYYDEVVIAKELRTFTRSAMEQLMTNYYLLLILLFIVIGCTILITTGQALNMKTKIIHRKPNLLDQMEL